ncbi:gasdermin Eb [Lampris incognitus]|uniref:gasdermin Eb n=1 Tax=Lampris incognitus TaxID=2546036 RepID=UPI0024B5C01F|nr:gasdermin Eb [Lampris incognitus]
MFATATENLVEEVDHDGFLIPVSSLNDSVPLLSLVVKRKRFWFWQKPKYIPTDFSINDVLTGDTPIQPAVIEADFIKYDGTFGGNIHGNVEATFVHSDLNVEGKDTSKLRSTFGSLKKEEVDVQKLLRDSKNRILDMSHSLIQQTKVDHRQVFGVVKERIVTTQPCSVIEEVQESGQLGGLLSFCAPKAPKVTLKENGSLSKDSNITMEIPPHTAVAYGLIELEVKLSGHFELCLMSNTDGSFEVDGLAKKELVGVSGPRKVNNSLLKQELQKLSGHFQLLSALTASTCSSLLQSITVAMEDQDALAQMETVLGQMCLGERPQLDDVQTAATRQNITAVLDLLTQTPTDQPVSALSAVHLVVSALDEMTDDCHAVLGTCCSPAVLQALELLVQCATGNEGLSLSSPGLAPLTGDVYTKAERLFRCCNVSLERDGDTLTTEIHHRPGHRPLVLCIAIRGLASLARSV